MAAFISEDLYTLITVSVQTLLFINLIATGRFTESCINERQFIAVQSPQQFSSINYPNPYRNNDDWCWYIQAQSDDQVVVAEIIDMDIEASITCGADRLQIKDGNSENSTVLASVCGRTVGSFFSTQRHMFIRFTTDHTLTDKGFQISYFSTSDDEDTVLQPDDVCDTTTKLTATNSYQYIYSPDYPHNYKGALDTCWIIETENEDFFVRIDVLESSLEYANPCSLADYVQIRDGPETGSSLLREWCGQQVPSPVTSTRRELLIRFRSNNEENNHSGFRIRYWSVASSTEDDNNMDAVLDSTGRVMIGIGVLLAFALIVSAFVYHKKYSKRRPNAVSNFSPGNSRHGQMLTGSGTVQRLHIPGGHRGRGPPGATTVFTPGEPGVYPAYGAPAQPAYGPYGAPPMPPGMIIAPPPYSASETSNPPLGPQPPDRTPIMTLDSHATPPPSYDDIIKDDPPIYTIDPPNYINTEPQEQPAHDTNQSRTRTQNNLNQTNNRNMDRF